MRSPELEDDQAELVNGDAAEMTTDGEEVVKKAKKKKSVSQSIHQTLGQEVGMPSAVLTSCLCSSS